MHVIIIEKTIQLCVFFLLVADSKWTHKRHVEVRTESALEVINVLEKPLLYCKVFFQANAFDLISERLHCCFSDEEVFHFGRLDAVEVAEQQLSTGLRQGWQHLLTYNLLRDDAELFVRHLSFLLQVLFRLNYLQSTNLRQNAADSASRFDDFVIDRVRRD